MATSTCPKCDSTSFEIQVFEILRAEYKHLCAKCGAVVGILDYYNIGNILVAQNKALEAIAEKLGIEVNLLTQQTRAEGRILPDASVTLLASDEHAKDCPDCGGTDFYYPNGFEGGVVKCKHERLAKQA